jgi:hypothetical protein
MEGRHVTSTFSKRLRFIVPVLSALTISAATSFAAPAHRGLFDGSTRYNWARTWHAPNALATPLNQYFIPRTPGNCGSGSTYTAWCSGCGPYGGVPYPPGASAGFEPVQFERLGQVPNELDLLGGVAMPAGAPATAPRQ